MEQQIAESVITWKDIVVFVVLPLVPIVLGFGLHSFTKKIEGKADNQEKISKVMHGETMTHLDELKTDVRENRKEIQEGRKEFGKHIEDHAKKAFGGGN